MRTLARMRADRGTAAALALLKERCGRRWTDARACFRALDADKDGVIGPAHSRLNPLETQRLPHLESLDWAGTAPARQLGLRSLIRAREVSERR